MKLVTRTSLLAAVAVVSVSMLIDTLGAVEVTSSVTPALPKPAPAAKEVGEILPELTPPSPDCFILGSRSFSIPFTVDAAGTRPVEVHLFVSRGAADSWRLLDRKRPDVAVKQFQFTADDDGEYWFATRTIDAQGRPHPAGAIQSQLKVYIDTTKPRVSLNVDADASGRVNAVLAIKDATPLKNVQLRYVTDNVEQWQHVEIPQTPPGGAIHFTPQDAWKQLSLQFVATDTPGNQSVVNHLLHRPRLALSPGSRYAAAGNPTQARSTPYRMNASEQLNAQPISSPVIQLDRNKLRRPPSLVTAHGYAPDSSRVESALDSFRGAAFPAQRPAPAMTMPPQLAPAPQVTPTPQTANAPQRAPGIPVPPAMQFGAVPQFGMAPQAPPPQPAPQATPKPQLPVGARYPTRPQPPTSSDGAFRSNQTLPTSPQRFSFGPPSIREASLPTNTTLTQTPPPPPATPEQIGNGFGLNSPQQTQPETAPAPVTSESTADQKPAPARTPAEAMRPISDDSAVPTSPEEIPAPKPEPDPNGSRYQSMRSSVVDSALAMSRAPVRYSDSERFSLAYELEAVGNQGVDAIELYGSTDAGKTWQLWGQDPDRNSPFDIETKESGVFGFRIVVVGSNGLASPRPLAGQTPDIVVVVDKTLPQVRITGAQYGEGDRIGSLVIRYECEDANLTQRPISLAFSDTLQGPWTTIAAGLRNDGDYVWPADPRLPRKLYLRIDATDQAGNVGTHILDQPIDAQGLAPRARIRGFQSLSGAEPPAIDEQTAKRSNPVFK